MPWELLEQPTFVGQDVLVSEEEWHDFLGPYTRRFSARCIVCGWQYVDTTDEDTVMAAAIEHAAIHPSER
jgi:hypothetical protein